MMKSLAMSGVLAMTCVIATPTVTAEDTIRTLTETVRGNIVEMSPNLVVVEPRAGISQKLPVNTIVSIRYDNEPDELADAKTQIRSQQLAEALNALNSINIDGIDRDVVKQEIIYLQAYCQAKLALGGVGTATKAAGAVNTFLKKFPGNYRYYEANELMGDLAVAAGRPDRAIPFYDKAEKAPWPEAKLRLALARARSYRAQGKHAQAIAEFDKVLGSGLQGPLVERYRLTAQLGRASGLAEINQGASAIAEVMNVIKSAEKGDTEVHARAYNALGDCYRTMNKPKEAAFQYLHVDLLYYQHPVLHAEALSRLAKLWDHLEKPDRASLARKKLAQQYPNSSWNKR